jgi:hypothetical protein
VGAALAATEAEAGAGAGVGVGAGGAAAIATAKGTVCVATDELPLDFLAESNIGGEKAALPVGTVDLVKAISGSFSISFPALVSKDVCKHQQNEDMLTKFTKGAVITIVNNTFILSIEMSLSCEKSALIDL